MTCASTHLTSLYLAHQVKPESAPVYAELMWVCPSLPCSPCWLIALPMTRAKKSQSYLIASQQNAKVIGSFSTQIGCLDEYGKCAREKEKETQMRLWLAVGLISFSILFVSSASHTLRWLWRLWSSASQPIEWGKYLCMVARMGRELTVPWCVRL